MRHWPQTGVAVQRIAQLIAVDDGHGNFNKLIKNRLGNIDTFNTAAALTGIKHRPVDQRFGRRLNIGIIHDIARILATKLKPKPGKTASGRLFDGAATLHRPGEIHKAK